METSWNRCLSLPICTTHFTGYLTDVGVGLGVWARAVVNGDAPPTLLKVGHNEHRPVSMDFHRFLIAFSGFFHGFPCFWMAFKRFSIDVRWFLPGFYWLNGFRMGSRVKSSGLVVCCRHLLLLRRGCCGQGAAWALQHAGGSLLDLSVWVASSDFLLFQWFWISEMHVGAPFSSLFRCGSMVSPIENGERSSFS